MKALRIMILMAFQIHLFGHKVVMRTGRLMLQMLPMGPILLGQGQLHIIKLLQLVHQHGIFFLNLYYQLMDR